MDRFDEKRATDRDERDEAESPRETHRPDSILGISDVAPDRPRRSGPDAGSTVEDDMAHEPGRPGSGAADLTGGTTGGTGPDTGGHGVHRRGSGATGVDLGNT
jgi:hypothetical protein